MNVDKKIWILTVLLVVIFFISTTTVTNYIENKKIVLVVNSAETIDDVLLEGLKVDGVLYGAGFMGVTDTDNKYILLKMKSQEIVYSSNLITDIVKYINKVEEGER